MWETKKLGDVCTLVKRGVAPKYVEESGICVINQKCIRDHSINFELARRHNFAVKPVPTERYIQLGDVLINSTGTGTLGRVAQVRSEPHEPATVDTHVTIVRPKPGMFFNDFFGYMLIKIEDEIAGSGEGTSGQTELALSKVQNDFNVSYPTSLEEQKRIVAILDEAFEGIDAAIANTQANLAASRELFDSYLDRVFANRDGNWTEKKLEDLCKKITVGHVGSMAKRYQPKGIPFLRSQNVLPFCISLKDVKYIDEKFNSELKKSELHPGDVAIVRTGYPGTAAVIPESLSMCNCSDIVIAKTKDQLSPHFLTLILNSKFGRKLVQANLVGAAQKHFNVTAAKNALVPLPNIIKQQEIIEQADKILHETRRLEIISNKKLDALHELKQSILAKAFRGELTQEKIAA